MSAHNGIGAAILDLLTKAAPLTSAEIRDTLDINSKQSADSLRELVKKGAVTFYIGSNNQKRWVLKSQDEASEVAPEPQPEPVPEPHPEPEPAVEIVPDEYIGGYGRGGRDYRVTRRENPCRHVLTLYEHDHECGVAMFDGDDVGLSDACEQGEAWICPPEIELPAEIESKLDEISRKLGCAECNPDPEAVAVLHRLESILDPTISAVLARVRNRLEIAP